MMLMMFSTYAQSVKRIPGEFVVRFKTQRNAARFFQRNGEGIVKNLKAKSGLYGKIKVHPQQGQSIIHRLLADSINTQDIARIEPNFVYQLAPVKNEQDSRYNHLRGRFYRAGVPADKMFDELWGLHNTKNEGIDVNALNAWEKTKGSKEVVIAVIDTGVDYTHPDIKDNMWVNTKEIPDNGIDDDGNGFIDDIYGYDFVNDDSDPMDDNDHGTHCSGTIGASHNSIGVAGVMGNVKIMALKFLSGRGGGTLDGAVRAIDYATEMGVDVMSNSWGGGGRSQILLDAIKRAEEKGIIFVAAAGNESNNNDRFPSYPASYGLDAQNVISVAAMDIEGDGASFTNYGVKSVHVTAPGVNIVSTTPGGRYKSFSGTSMATPHVSGVVGLLLSTNSRRAVKVTSKNIREWLIRSSKPHEALKKTSLSGGYVDAFSALTGQGVLVRRR